MSRLNLRDRSVIPRKVQTKWARIWMRFAGLTPSGRIATRLATWFSPPYKGRVNMARLVTQGYVSPKASIHHKDLDLGKNVFIDDSVVIYQAKNGGPVIIGKGVHVYRYTVIETGTGGSLVIGADTHIQPRCQFSAYKGSITIGQGVQIAPNCAFYPYAHGFAPGELIKNQPLQTKGGIIINDDAWLGVAVVVLDGVRIGKGAVIGAGSVVTNDIPEGGIAAGVPAHLLSMRSDLANNTKRMKVLAKTNNEESN